MAADSEEKCFLRFNLPLDLRDESDGWLYEVWEEVPNGLKQQLIKMIMLRAIPQDEEGRMLLYAEALREQTKSGRQRGRPKIRPQSPDATPSTKRKIEGAQAVPLAGTSEQEKGPAAVVPEGEPTGLPQQVETPVETQQIVPVTARTGNKLDKFSSMLGSTNWQQT